MALQTSGETSSVRGGNVRNLDLRGTWRTCMNREDIEMLEYVFGKENVVVFDEVRKMNGTVTRVVIQKAFGFITGEDKQDYFFHRTDFNGFFDDLVKDLEKKRVIKVTFEPASTEKGLRANQVTRVDGGTPDLHHN